MKKFKHLLIKLLLITIGTSIPIVLTDQYMRFANLPKNKSRVMLLSGGKLDSSRIGIRSYTPNSSLLQSAIYGDILTYSYEFKTDQNGFRISNECKDNSPKNNLVAITGDSFTEGQGSSISWIASIQKKLCNQGKDSINAAIAGYGIEGMQKSLVYAYERLGARKAIVAIIPENIQRIDTRMVSNEICSMYKSTTCGLRTTWWHHPKNLSEKELISFAKKKNKTGIIPALKSFGLHLRRRILSYSSRDTKIFQKNIDAMRSIISMFGPNNVSIIILPTKIDRNLNSSFKNKTIRNQKLKIFLDSINENVTVKDIRDCPLDQRHFILNDGHPNESGHKLLGICASSKISKEYN